MRKGKLVLASGTFDLLHYGHLKFLEEAKKAGGKNARLIVIVARDSTVKRMKGSKPVIPEDQRRALVDALKPVDAALLGYSDLNLESVIKKINPDIIAIGHDQGSIEKALKKIITKKHLATKVVKIGKFGAETLNSSSKIKRKIVESWE
jgi:FAD synthetase